MYLIMEVVKKDKLIKAVLAMQRLSYKQWDKKLRAEHPER